MSDDTAVTISAERYARLCAVEQAAAQLAGLVRRSRRAQYPSAAASNASPRRDAVMRHEELGAMAALLALFPDETRRP